MIQSDDLKFNTELSSCQDMSCIEFNVKKLQE